MRRAQRRAAERFSQQNATISEAQLAANRANAQHSSGPRTQTGRATSAQNRTTHGLARHNGPFCVLPTEDLADYESLKASLIAEHQPKTATETILITTMTEAHWLANRAQRLSDCTCEPDSGLVASPDHWSVYLRYQTTHRRAFYKALNELQKLRAERHKVQIGFEAQKRQDEQQVMKKQSHQLQILHKIATNTAQQMKAAKQIPGFEAQFTTELAKHGLSPDPYQATQATAA